MRFGLLQWVFAALFVLFGLPLFVVTAPAAHRLLMGLSLVFLGAFAIAMALEGRASGRLVLHNRLIERATRPRLFTALTAGIGASGIAVVVMALAMLFGA